MIILFMRNDITSKKHIALTFDDGPNNNTKMFLIILGKIMLMLLFLCFLVIELWKREYFKEDG